MRQSKLFTKTQRDAPADEVAVNAQLLQRAGFAFKNSAGVYSYLPLGWRVMGKISAIVREEMNAIDGQEMFMPALVEKKYMVPSGRWDLDVGYFARSKDEADANFTLGWTHEEVLTAIAVKFVNSYKDLPFAAYQIQTKFRHEARAKSGLLRGREFMMKDLYSFHASDADLDDYYEKVRAAYQRVFARCSLAAIYTLATGGVFTKNFTHEFQVVADVGEDTVYICSKCTYAENEEISKMKEGSECPKCGGAVEKKQAIEVGNIFKQGTKYSEDLGLHFTDEDGTRKPVVMGSYGIGVSRLLATVVELNHDENGIIWPKSIAPFQAHLIALRADARCEALYEKLTAAGIEVLYDDRDKSPGEKFADADLIGIPVRITIGGKTPEGKVEFKLRSEKEFRLVDESELGALLKN